MYLFDLDFTCLACLGTDLPDLPKVLIFLGLLSTRAGLLARVELNCTYIRYMLAGRGYFK